MWNVKGEFAFKTEEFFLYERAEVEVERQGRSEHRTEKRRLASGR